jgi:hypothetical protein
MQDEGGLERNESIGHTISTKHKGTFHLASQNIGFIPPDSKDPRNKTAFIEF